MESPIAEIVGSTESAAADANATTVGAEGSAPSGAESTAATDPVSPEKKRDEVNERFDKLTRDLYELRGERDRDRFDLQSRDKRIQELEAQLAETAKQREVAPHNTPTLEQFGFDEAKYQAALYEHLTKTVGAKVRDEILGEIEQTESKRRAQESYSSWEKREADFIKSQPDYVDKVKNARTLPISKEMAEEIMQMDDGPQIAYYLAENRAKAELIAKLPPKAQMRELGRIQAQLEAKKAPPAPPVSKAPPPVNKVDSSDAVVEKTPEQMTDLEFAKWRKKQIAARRTA